MKAAAAMLFVLGLFATYGSWRVQTTQEIGNARYAQSAGGSVSAQEDPERFGKTLFMINAMAVGCFVGCAVIVIRNRNK
jgi:hypothetical protein